MLQKRLIRATVFAATVLSVLLPGPRARLVAQSAGASQEKPEFLVRIDYVNVDVTVTDGQGNFVRDLRQDEFELYEDGKRQTLAAFGLIDRPVLVRDPVKPGAPAAAPPRPESDVRSNVDASIGRAYVIVLDDLHVEALRSNQVKRVAREFVERYFSPNDIAAVLHTSGRSDVGQDFTTSPRLLLRSIDAFAGRKLRSSVLEQLDQYQREQEMDMPTDADLRLRRIIDPRDAERADQARNTLKTLTQLGDLLSAARGRRKAVVLLSEGIDYDLQEGITQTSSGISTFTRPYASQVRDDLQRAIRAANLANTSVYAIDPRGLASTGDELIQVGSFPENPQLGLSPTAFQDELRVAQDSLRIIGDETGGAAFVSSNDFTKAFDRIVRDVSTYYMLGYQPPSAKQDGRFHKIEVKVTRPGLKIQSRRGYTASPPAAPVVLSAEAERSPIVRDALNNPLPIAGLPMQIFAAPFKDTSGASVVVGLEMAADKFKFEPKNGVYEDRIEAALVAVDSKGAFHAGGHHTVELKLKPDTYAAVQAHGVRLLFRIPLPAGRFQLRAAAHEMGANVSGSVFYDLEVPDFARESLALSGLVITAPRAMRTPTAQNDSVLEGVLPTPPTSVRVFNADETVTTLFEVYGGAPMPSLLPQPGQEAVELVTTLRSADGQVRHQIEEKVSDADMHQRNGVLGYAARIPLAEVAPGPYTIRVEVKKPSNPGQVVTREVPIEVAAPASPPAHF